MELTVLGCSGSYGSPAGGACSGYLVRAGDAVIWMDCGNGSFANLQQHANPADLTAVVITHAHADHCVDIYGLHVLYKYGLEMQRPSRVRARRCREDARRASSGSGPTRSTGSSSATATAPRSATSQLQFSRTDHPLPTVGVELEHGGKRLVYTADTGPGWSVEAFRPGADLVLSEATYQHDDIRAPIHLSARQAGEAARAAKARRLMLTHLWPTLDPVASVEEGSEAFGHAVTLAAPHLVTHL